MTAPLLVCVDLDRTLLPNGEAPESPLARPLFRRFAARPEVTIAYVTGRDRGQVERAIARWDLPQPDFVAADVGTTLYTVGAAAAWTEWTDWRDAIGRDWLGRTAADLAPLVSGLPGLTPQPPERQGRFKLSYTAPADADGAALCDAAMRRLDAAGIAAATVWSIDETVPVGLLDILPQSATKQGAVEFLMLRLGFAAARTLFAGDSGNDLPVLCGPLRTVLVANASAAVRATALACAAESGKGDRLYLAHGGFLGMNGAYAAGILEGIAHFFPETRDWLIATGLQTHD